MSRRAFPLLAFLIALNPGLLLVDHVHFQYNGLLLGVLMLSLEALQRDRFVLSAFLFAVLVNMKHLFAVAGPFYFVYMLRRYCVGKFAMSRFLLLGAHKRSHEVTHLFRCGRVKARHGLAKQDVLPSFQV